MGARGLQADLPAAEAGQLGVGGVGALNGESDGAVRVERVCVVTDQTVKPQVVDGVVDVQKPQVGPPLVQRDRTQPTPNVDVLVEVVNELERLIAVGVEVGNVADEHFQPQCRDEQQRHNGFQPLAAKAVQPGGDKPGPAVQCCDGHETERIEADGQPGAVVGKAGEQPGGQP